MKKPIMQSLLIIAIIVSLVLAACTNGQAVRYVTVTQKETITQTETSVHTITLQPTGATKATITPTNEASEIIFISAADLASEYDSNGFASDQKYKGRILNVTGVIDEITEEYFGDVYVLLESETTWWHAVRCYLSNTSQLLSLYEGQTVSIKGKCIGEYTSFYLNYHNVILENCEIVNS